MKMTSKGIISLDEINALPFDTFEWLFANVIEHCPEASATVADKRPFLTVQSLKTAFDEFLDKLDSQEQESILTRHPDLAGKLADEGKLTLESQNEQKSAGLDSMTEEQKDLLNINNYLYKEKFGFPFVICARKNDISTIITEMGSRLKNHKETELKTGIEEVKKICQIRIDELMWPDLKL